MNKILIIPDVHGRDFWIEPLNKYIDEVDEVIFLGDYLDPYLFDFEGKSKDNIEFESILNLKLIITEARKNSKIKLLLGNHDFHYIYNMYNGSRKITTYNKDIQTIFNDNLDLFKIAHESYVNNIRYIFTHAGVMDGWLEFNKLNPKIDITELNLLLGDSPGVLWQPSMTRGGRYKYGSCIWAHCSDLYYENMNIKKDYYQIFGHTYSTHEQILNNVAMLDCKHAFLLTNENKIEKI